MAGLLNKKWKVGEGIGLLLLRIGLGIGIFIGHGLPKWKVIFQGRETQFADPLGIGSEISFYLVLFAEGICFLFVILGLFTRLALIPLIIAMFVAVFVFHANSTFGDYEMSLIYLFGFVALFLTGPGSYSIDEQYR